MNQSNDNKFNKEWQKVFKDASETPPPSIWQALDKRLDEEQDKVIPLVWWKNPRIMYAAASIVVILMAGIGVLIKWGPSEKMEVAVTQGGNIENTGRVAIDGSEVAKAEHNEVNSVDSPSSLPEMVASAETNSVVENNVLAAETDKATSKTFSAVEKGSHRVILAPHPALSVEENAGRPTYAQESDLPVSTFDDHERLSNVHSSSSILESIEIAAIDNGDKPWVEKNARFNKRLVFYRPDIPEEVEEDAAKVKKEYYAGAGVMPSMFNPNVSIASNAGASTTMGFAKVANRKENMPSRSGASLAMQTYGGMKINKNWSIETGISYLKGNSVFESRGSVMNVMNVTVANELESALANTNMKVADKLYGPNYALNSPSVQAGDVSLYYLDIKENYRNNYSFIQLPVQAGFTLAPENKLSYTLLGGVIGNLFLKNELNLTTGGTLVTSISDGTYQPLHWSATSGLRLNYRLAENWSAMLTGTYQKAFYDAGNQGNVVQFKPQLFGVGWGVKLNF